MFYRLRLLWLQPPCSMFKAAGRTARPSGPLAASDAVPIGSPLHCLLAMMRGRRRGEWLRLSPRRGPAR